MDSATALTDCLFDSSGTPTVVASSRFPWDQWRESRTRNGISTSNSRNTSASVRCCRVNR